MSPPRHGLKYELPGEGEGEGEGGGGHISCSHHLLNRICFLMLTAKAWGFVGHGEDKDKDVGSGDDEAEFAWLPVNALKTFGEGKKDGIAVEAAAKDPTLQVSLGFAAPVLSWWLLLPVLSIVLLVEMGTAWSHRRHCCDVEEDWGNCCSPLTASPFCC